MRLIYHNFLMRIILYSEKLKIPKISKVPDNYHTTSNNTQIDETLSLLFNENNKKQDKLKLTINGMTCAICQQKEGKSIMLNITFKAIYIR